MSDQPGDGRCHGSGDQHNAVEGFFAKLTRRRLKRGVFHSLVDLQAAITDIWPSTTRAQNPFTWTADPDRIIAAAGRGYQVLDSKTLRQWVRQAERDQGVRPGPTTEERERIKALERENRELRQANEILRKASAYFAQAELDRRFKP